MSRLKFGIPVSWAGPPHKRVSTPLGDLYPVRIGFDLEETVGYFEHAPAPNDTTGNIIDESGKVLVEYSGRWDGRSRREKFIAERVHEYRARHGITVAADVWDSVSS